MGTFPVTPRSDFLAWCGAHAPVFLEHADGIGLSEQIATEYAAAMQAARAAVLKQEEARLAAESATTAANAALATLRGLTRQAVERVRLHAETTGDAEVFALAQITPVASPTPVPPPGRITDFRADLEPTTGFVRLRFKCTNPASAAGTTYLVRRRLPGETQETFLGLAEHKRFTDTTLPRGVTTAQYTVQAHRGSIAGPVSLILTVHFGAVSAETAVGIIPKPPTGTSADITGDTAANTPTIARDITTRKAA